MPAHDDDPSGVHLFCCKHAHEADRAVADNDNRRAGLGARRVGGIPAGTQHIGRRQQARN